MKSNYNKYSGMFTLQNRVRIFLKTIPVEFYTRNFAFASKYGFMLRFCQSLVGDSLSEDVVLFHLEQIGTVKGYFHFIRVWKARVGANKLAGVLTAVDRKILNNIAIDVYENTTDQIQSIKMLNYISTFLNTRDELKDVYKYLEAGIKRRMENHRCGFCHTKSMKIHEEVLVCNKCGFSTIL